ncbi:MAG TPA: histidinol dehydrogenase, partial [Fimbriimonas sp.]|nr:histidinol dehydrogenase [Fimbriimonas sp.]
DFSAIAANVQQWISRVKNEGDAAILDYLRTFDQRDGRIGWKPADTFSASDFLVSAKEIAEAFDRVPADLKKAINEQVKLSRNFHNKLAETLTSNWQIEQWPGVTAGYRRVPVDSAGLYVPAGKAPLPTVAQILTVAAKAAQVPDIFVVFPPTDQVSEDAIIYAATQAGVDDLFRVGGIAAIAALAFGTETIPKVAKIAGPGNLYVQAAKFFVSDRVGIDMIAGPSEAMFIADETADPDFIALDLLAQCEHGPDSAGIVITTSREVATQIQEATERHLQTLERATYAKKAIEKYSAILVASDVDELVNLVNEYAPEHLEIQTKDSAALSQQLNNVGSVFLGRYSPVAAGDYATGTNHTLPTGGAARYASAVSPETFLRTVQFQELTKEGVGHLLPIVDPIATAEGLIGHLDSVRARVSD